MIDYKNYTYSPKVTRTLFGGHRVSPILDFSFEGARNAEAIAAAMQRISVSGVQEKFPAVIENGKIRLAGDGERSTHILKPAPWDETLQDRKQIPANEHLTMQIASQVYGITIAANGLCFTKKGQPVYITKRFDILPDGTKLPMEDFAAVIGRNEQEDGTEFKYRGCYEDIADAIKKNVQAWMVDMERFFDLVVFNYIYANGDDHLKNFSLIRQDQDYRLAPAYDLLNTSRSAAHHRVDGVQGVEPSAGLVHAFGDEVRGAAEALGAEAAEAFVGRSFLTDKMKRYYLRIVRERIARFTSRF